MPRFNKKAVRHELDKAAVELDKHGHKDLADKVDYYNTRLMAAKTDRDVQILHRAINRVYKEACRREQPPKAKKVSKAKSAVLRARRLATRKLESQKRRESAKKDNKSTNRSIKLKKLLAARKRRLESKKESSRKDAIKDLRMKLRAYRKEKEVSPRAKRLARLRSKKTK